MSMVINTNIASINSQRHISTAVREQSEAMERLSSGKRINSSKDDAAGLGIANKMTSQIRGLDQAVRNANDGISMIQIADGALDQTTTVLQRMRELSIQSANGTYNDGENRQALDAEFQQLLMEIDRISESTMFNGNPLLDGTMKNTSLQIGADAYQTVEFGIGDMGSKSLGMNSISSDVLGSEFQFSTASIGYNDININGQSIIKSGEANFTAGSSGDVLINAINNNVNGVTANLVGIHEIQKLGDGTLSGSDQIEIKLTMADGSEQSFVARDVASYDELAEKLNQLSNGVLNASNESGNFIITAEGVSKITVEDGTSSLLGGSTTSSSVDARLALSSDDGDPITIERGTTGTYNDLINLGFRETTEPGVVEGFAITAPSDAWDADDITINGVSIIETGTSSSLINKVAAINNATEQTGVKAETYIQAAIDISNVVYTAGSNANLILNGTEIAASSSTSDLIDNINSASSTTGITAKLSGTKVQLEGNASALQISRDPGDTLSAASITFGSGATANSEIVAIQTADSNNKYIHGGLKLTSSDGSPISIDLGTAHSASEHGFIDSNITAGGKYGTSIDGLDISSANNAQKSIGAIDRAVTTVSMQRGELGAVNNRLEHAIDSMMNVSQQTSAARSRITDTDFAKESAALSRAQVLQQAGTAMLSQANAAPNQVLQLLQG